MILNRLINILTSLRLTVACLFGAIILVFVGTLAQVKLGLYVTQEQYFRSLIVFWTPSGSNLKIPVFPGGYLLGGVLLANLIAAHIKRFKFAWKKSGIFLTHIGLILLLIGQFLTEVFQVESLMRIEEGKVMNYSEDSRANELAIVDVSEPDTDKVVSIPQGLLAKGAEIKHAELPFAIRVKDMFRNSFPGGPMVQGSKPRISATKGAGQRLPFDEEPITAKMDDENRPAALVEIVTDEGSLGDWTVSTWLTKSYYRKYLSDNFGAQAASGILAPQQFTHDGRTYQLELRPTRYYKPYSIKLLDFTHARYKGTEIPKDFSSRIHLTDPVEKVDREVLIYMNNPLRYGGETYFQGSFEPGDTVSIFQVVRNPAWLTPYLSCILVGVGLIVQFMIHLARFIKKSGTRGRSVSSPLLAGKSQRPAMEMAGAAARTAVTEGGMNRGTTTRRRNK